jgi:hypothetical protein
MKQVYKAFYGALLVVGLAGVTPVPAIAGGHFDAACNCMRPESEFNTRREVRAPARVVTRERIVNQTRVVRGNTRLIQENRLVVHVRPVINREVVVHRVNTIVRNVELHRVNTTNKFREEVHNQVVNRFVPGETRQVLERREVQGVNCNCENDFRRVHNNREVVSFRD